MNHLIQSPENRGYMLLASYGALCLHFVILAGYIATKYLPKMPALPYWQFLLASMVCIAIYILLAITNGWYAMAIIKTIICIPLLLLEYLPVEVVFVAFVAYYLFAFFDMYNYRVKV